MGDQLARSLPPPAGSGPVIVTSVPMHWRRRARRGFDQARLGADSLAAARNWPCQPLLRRTRHTRPQSRLAPTVRRRNVRGSFAAWPIDLTGHTIVLVDDVKTTGATLSACARLLRRRNARLVHAAVVAVASDPRRGQAPARR